LFLLFDDRRILIPACLRRQTATKCSDLLVQELLPRARKFAERRTAGCVQSYIFIPQLASYTLAFYE